MVRLWSACFALLGGVVLANPASAVTTFSENFNGYTGTLAGQQPGTGLNVYTNGSLPGWYKSAGGGSLNALDRGAGNYAIMFYDTNLIYNLGGSASNNLGSTYTVSFTGSLTTSTNAAQVSGPGDYVQFIVNDSSGTIGSYQYHPDLTTTAFLPYSFTYNGTGNGNVYFVIMDGVYNGTYGGAIDDLVVTTTALNADVPEPASMALLGSGLLAAGMLRRRASKRVA